MSDLSPADIRTLQDALGKAKLQLDSAHEAAHGSPAAAAAALARLRQIADGNSGCGCGNCGCACGAEVARSAATRTPGG